MNIKIEKHKSKTIFEHQKLVDNVYDWEGKVVIDASKKVNCELLPSYDYCTYVLVFCIYLKNKIIKIPFLTFNIRNKYTKE